MLIDNYYYGSTGRLTGVVYDTNEKTYKKYVLKGKEFEEPTKASKIYPKKGFKSPGDMEYSFKYLSECDWQLDKLDRLGFKEDDTMVLDFGIFKR